MSDMLVVLFILCAAGLIIYPTKATGGDKSITNTSISNSSFAKALDIYSKQDRDDDAESILPEPILKKIKVKDRSSVVLTKSKSSWYKLTKPLALHDTWFAPVNKNTVKHKNDFKPEMAIYRCTSPVIKLLPHSYFSSAQSQKDHLKPKNIQEYIVLPLASSPNGSEIHLTKNTIISYHFVPRRNDTRNDINKKMKSKEAVRPAKKYFRFQEPIGNEYVNKNTYIMNKDYSAMPKIARIDYLPNTNYGDKKRQGSIFPKTALVNPAQPASYQKIPPKGNSHIQLPRVHTVFIRWNLILV